jgi:hypothetical protein
MKVQISLNERVIKTWSMAEDIPDVGDYINLGRTGVLQVTSREFNSSGSGCILYCVEVESARAKAA